MFGTLVVGTLAAIAPQDRDARRGEPLYIDIQIPAVEIQIPNIEIPELELYFPGYELYLPSFDLYLPSIDIYIQELDIEIPQVEVDTDTTFEVDPNGRLELRNHEGEIVVKTWNRNAVRVEARHSSDDRVKIHRSGSVVKVRSESRYGHPDIVNYELTVPRSMAIDLSGNETAVWVEGVQNGLRVETIEGDVTVRDCAGEITLHSVEGVVRLERARGRVEMHSTDGAIEVIDVEGEIFVESIDGNIWLESINSGMLEAQTVDGDVFFDGSVRNDGRYRLSTHDGNVTVRVPDGTNATVSVATFEGAFEAMFPVEITRAESGRQFSFILGSGGARIELETFDGDIRLERR